MIIFDNNAKFRNFLNTSNRFESMDYYDQFNLTLYQPS